MTIGTIKKDEYHPAADNALNWMRDRIDKFPVWVEVFTLTRENRLSQICLETLERLMNDQPVSDRYLLGLVWVLKDLEAPVAERHTLGT